MAEAGRISILALQATGAAACPGVSTLELDHIAEDIIREHGAVSAFKGYLGYPATICASINDELVHGIPSAERVLSDGDILTVDVGAIYQGYVGDNADTFAIGTIDDESQRLIDTTRAALYAAIDRCVEGNRLGDVSAAIQATAEEAGYGAVREYCGHGIGAKMHEEPSVPNVGKPGTGPRLRAGMTLAIEPMLTAGDFRVQVRDDGWTVVTQDGSRCAQIEHTVAIGKDAPLILTVI